MDTLAVVLLALVALIFSVAAPRVMAPQTSFRLCPGPALLVWQCVAVSGILAALLAAPVAAWSLTDRTMPLVWAAGALSAIMLGRLLLSAHRVGTGLRILRQRHRDLVDLLGQADPHSSVTVLPHASPTAYCVPGARRQIVLTAGALEALEPDELGAVLAHERAHLGARHDLILEFFSVLHHAVPRPVRCEAALSEVHLLVEALADRAALRVSGARPLARALVTMSQGAHPEATMGVGGTAELTRTRLLLIADAANPRRGRAVVMICFAVLTLTIPLGLAALGV
ncbi:MAG: M56 family metallopeptidase [Ornithinimicrobium sp.]